METNRILSITIHNIKNVKNGTLDFCENENVKKIVHYVIKLFFRCSRRKHVTLVLPSSDPSDEVSPGNGRLFRHQPLPGLPNSVSAKRDSHSAARRSYFHVLVLRPSM